MSLVIYKDNKERPPLKRYEEITDDYGIVWKAKMGEYKQPHWAIAPGQDIYAEENEPITEWHLGWQELFKQKGFSLEVTRFNNKQYRRADILCEKRKVVVEIQYSPISGQDIKARTDFWIEQGYKVVWIFSKEWFEKGAEPLDTLKKRIECRYEPWLWEFWEEDINTRKESIKEDIKIEAERLKTMHYSRIPQYILADVNACFAFNTKHGDLMCMYEPNSYFFKDKRISFKHSLRFTFVKSNELIEDIEQL